MLYGFGCLYEPPNLIHTAHHSAIRHQQPKLCRCFIGFFSLVRNFLSTCMAIAKAQFQTIPATGRSFFERETFVLAHVAQFELSFYSIFVYLFVYAVKHMFHICFLSMYVMIAESGLHVCIICVYRLNRKRSINQTYSSFVISCSCAVCTEQHKATQSKTESVPLAALNTIFLYLCAFDSFHK